MNDPISLLAIRQRLQSMFPDKTVSVHCAMWHNPDRIVGSYQMWGASVHETDSNTMPHHTSGLSSLAELLDTIEAWKPALVPAGSDQDVMIEADPEALPAEVTP
jgi:hypothetical protein